MAKLMDDICNKGVDPKTYFQQYFQNSNTNLEGAWNDYAQNHNQGN